MKHPHSVSEWMAVLTGRLRLQSETALLEAQVLLAHIAGCSRSWIMAHPEARLTPAQEERLDQALQEIEEGKPLPYILGEWEFFGLKFAVNPAVLIPRPETETLVQAAISASQDLLRQKGAPLRAIDVGTGSGCIAISIALHQPQISWVASDRSMPALKVARQNIQSYGVQERIALLQADLLEPFTARVFDLICANLPYIPSAALRQLAVYRREPTLALDGGPDGLTLIRKLFEQAADRLTPGGVILAEIEATQGKAAQSIARACFPEGRVFLQPDLAGYDRVLIIKQA